MDGHGDPFQADPDVAIMGYSFRVDQWRQVKKNIRIHHRYERLTSLLHSLIFDVLLHS